MHSCVYMYRCASVCMYISKIYKALKQSKTYSLIWFPNFSCSLVEIITMWSTMKPIKMNGIQQILSSAAIFLLLKWNTLCLRPPWFDWTWNHCRDWKWLWSCEQKPSSLCMLAHQLLVNHPNVVPMEAWLIQYLRSWVVSLYLKIQWPCEDSPKWNDNYNCC